MKSIIFVILSICIAFTFAEEDSKILPEEQPNCRFTVHTLSFYENHAYNLKNMPTKNWICGETFDRLLKYCFTMYKIMSSRKVETEYKVEKDVARECKTHTMIFWLPNHFGSAPSNRVNVSLDVQTFRCPITKMDLKFPKADNAPELHDFYITEGRNNDTVAVLRNSTGCDNICLTNMYRPKDDFRKEIF